MTIKNALSKAEDTVRCNRHIKSSSLGKAVLEKFALPSKLSGTQQCFRLKKRALRIVEGDPESQFATIISRLEQLRLVDTRTRIQV